jgi:hypothetical protein
MDIRRAGCVALFVSGLFWVPTSAAGQDTASPAPARQEAPAASGIDADRLPIDLHRIERQLRQTSERQDYDGPRLRYYVDVYGTAPKIDLFAPEESLTFGPVPGAAPTHREMLDFVTPQEFRSPPMDFSSFVRWLSDKIGK